MKKLNAKKKKILIVLSSVILFILVAAGLFFGTYYLVINKSYSDYEKAIKKNVQDINSINQSMSSFIKGQSIDVDKLRKGLSAKIDSLTEEKTQLQLINPTEKFSKNHENLINGLNNNILMYKQMAAILNSPTSSDASKALDDLNNFQNQCTSYYAKVNLKNIQISLPKGAANLLDNTNSYIREIIKVTRDSEILKNQASEFVNSMSSIISKLDPIRIDLNSEALKARNGSKSFDDVLALIDKNSDILDEINKEYSNITIPQKAIPCYKIFKTLLDDYGAYLQSFKYALSNEKLKASNGSNLSQSDIDALYKTPNSKFNQADKDYNDFTNLYTQFKTSVLN